MSSARSEITGECSDQTLRFIAVQHYLSCRLHIYKTSVTFAVNKISNSAKNHTLNYNVDIK